MSYADVEVFLKNDTTFLGDTASCAYWLSAHSILVDIMMGPMAPFIVAYRQCTQALQPHLLLSLKLHYGGVGGGAYRMVLQILYWMAQQFLYFLLECKFNCYLAIPDFQALVCHVHTKMLDCFPGQLPATWLLEQIQPTATVPTTGKATSTNTSKSEKVRGAHTLVTNTNYKTAH
jgi:hypothetical protein